jgi:putative Holliday junction resolvase
VILAIDFGLVRIGLAMGEQIASEYRTILNNDGAISEILKIIGDEQVDTVVIGRPVRSRGEKGSIDEHIDFFVQAIKLAVPHITICESNEAFTTSAALSDLKEKGLSIEASKKRVDQYAAKLLLQQYIDEQMKKA